MRRMQILGVYRDVPLTRPAPQANAVDSKLATVTGISITSQREEDQEYTVFECYCELNIPGFEHKRDGNDTGLPLPYRVTIDKDSRTILEIRDSNGNVIPSSGQNAPRQVISQQASWLMTDILKDSTDPAINNIFGPRLQIVNGVEDPLVPGSARRPAAAKTGTTNDLRDLSVYGYLPVEQDPNLPIVVASVWMGNSDHSPPLGGDVSIIAADGPGRIWSAFLRDLTQGWPVAPFPPPPSGVVAATIDAWSGGAPGPPSSMVKPGCSCRKPKLGSDASALLVVPICSGSTVVGTNAIEKLGCAGETG
jgi:hypothetical protein